MTTFQEMIDYVAAHSTEQEVRALFEAGNARLRHVRSIESAKTLSNLSEGTVVRLRNLKPKYLNGLTGTVVGFVGASGQVTVKLDDVSAIAARRYVSLDHKLTVSAAALAIVCGHNNEELQSDSTVKCLDCDSTL